MKLLVTLIFSFSLLFVIPLISPLVANISIGSVYAADDEYKFTPPESLENIHTDILNNVSDTFKQQTASWQETIKKYANRLFYLLVSISFFWNAISLALKRAEIGEIFVNLTKYIITVGFFKFLLESGPTLALTVVQTFSQIGAAGAGLGVDPTTKLAQFGPSTIVDVGLEFFYAVQSSMSDSWSDIPKNFILYLICLIFFALCLYIAIKVLIQMIALWCYVYAGALLLGFGGSKWTQNIAIGYFKGILAAAVKYYTSIFLVAIMSSLLLHYLDKISNGPALANIMTTLQMVALPVIFFFVMNSIPDMIASIAKGWGDFGFGDTQSSQIMSTIGKTVAAPAAATAVKGAAVTAGAVGGGAVGATMGAAKGAFKENTSGGAWGATKAAFSGAMVGGVSGAAIGASAAMKGNDNKPSVKTRLSNLSQAIKDSHQEKVQLKKNANGSNTNSNNTNCKNTNSDNASGNNDNSNKANSDNQQGSEKNGSSSNSSSNSAFSNLGDQTTTDDQKGASEAQMNNNEEKY